MSQEVYRQRIQSRQPPQGLLRGFVPVGNAEYTPPPPKPRKLTAEEQLRQRAAQLEPQAVALAASLGNMNRDDRREQLALIRRNDRQLYGLVMTKLAAAPAAPAAEAPNDGGDLSSFIQRPTNEQQLVPPVLPPTYAPGEHAVSTPSTPPSQSLHAVFQQPAATTPEVPVRTPVQTPLVPPPAPEAVSEEFTGESEDDINAAAEAAASEPPATET